jgi:hypothetical protein
MPGTVTVSTWRTNPTGRLPLTKGRAAGQQAHRRTGTTDLSSYEARLADLVYSMYQSMPTPPDTLDGVSLAAYDRDLLDNLVEFVDPLRAILQEQVDRAGQVASTELGQLLSREYRRVGKAAPLPSDMVLNLQFDKTNTRALAFANDEAGRLVTNMVAEQRQVVRDIIGEAYRTGMTPDGTARQLRTLLTTVRPGTPEAQQIAQLFGTNVNGLTLQYERAVVNRAGALAADLTSRGIDGEKAYNLIRRDTEKYAAQLRRTRARTIARTETMRANNAGRMASYQQAMDDGFLSPQHSLKQWEVSPFDVCPICVGLGQGKPVKMDDYFQAGNVAVPYPPAHPNCRCTFNVVPNSQMYDTPRQVGTGEPGDPYRFDTGYGPRGVDTGRTAAPTPQPAPPGSAPSPAPTPRPGEVLVEPAGKVPGHIIEPTGRVRLVDADEYREMTGQWFRRKPNATEYDEFIPSRNSGAGQVDRAIRADPEKYTPAPTPTDEIIEAAGKVPEHVVEPSGRVRLGNDQYRDEAGTWFRRKPGTDEFEAFTPSRNSGAGQVDRAIKTNPDRYKPRGGGGQPAPTPTTPQPPAPTPTQVAPEVTGPNPLRIEVPQSARDRTRVLRDSTKYDDLLEPETMPQRASRHATPKGEWVGGTATQEAQAAMAELKAQGRRVADLVEEVTDQRAGPVRAEVDAARQTMDDIEARIAVLDTNPEVDDVIAALEDILSPEALGILRRDLEALGPSRFYSLGKQFQAGGGNWTPRITVDEFRFNNAIQRAIRDSGEGFGGHYRLRDQITARLLDTGVFDQDRLTTILNLREELGQARNLLHEATTRLQEVRRQVLREIMEASRPDFGTGSARQWFAKVGSSPKAGASKRAVEDALEEIARNIPKEWLDNWGIGRTGFSADGTRVPRRDWVLKWVKRGYYDERNGVVALSPGSWKSTLQHEIQHGVQGTNNPLYLSERLWLKLRSDAERVGGADRISWRAREHGYRIDGIGQYTTREYLESRGYRGYSQATEVSTTGMEAIWHGNWTKIDQDWRDYLLGVLLLL